MAWSESPIRRERKNLTKGRVTFIVKTPSELDAEALEEGFEDVPEERRVG